MSHSNVKQLCYTKHCPILRFISDYKLLSVKTAQTSILVWE